MVKITPDLEDKLDFESDFTYFRIFGFWVFEYTTKNLTYDHSFSKNASPHFFLKCGYFYKKKCGLLTMINPGMFWPHLNIYVCDKSVRKKTGSHI